MVQTSDQTYQIQTKITNFQNKIKNWIITQWSHQPYTCRKYKPETRLLINFKTRLPTNLHSFISQHHTLSIHAWQCVLNQIKIGRTFNTARHEDGAHNHHRSKAMGTTENVEEEEGNLMSSPEWCVAEAKRHHHDGCGTVQGAEEVVEVGDQPSLPAHMMSGRPRPTCIADTRMLWTCKYTGLITNKPIKKLYINWLCTQEVFIEWKWFPSCIHACFLHC